MTAEEIRKGLSVNKAEWMGAPLYVGSFGVQPLILIEIAAQLAELNQTLKDGQLAELGKPLEDKP